MWSDRRRGWSALFAALLLALVCARYALDATGRWAAYPRAIEAGQVADGRVLRLPLWRVTHIDGSNRYRVGLVVQDVPVEGPTAGLTPGDTVTVVGRFRAVDRVIVADLQKVHGYRKWKERLGVLGFLLAAAGAPLGFAWRRGRLVERA